MPNSTQDYLLESIGCKKKVIKANPFINICIYRKENKQRENVIISSHGGFVDNNEIEVPQGTQFIFYGEDGDLLKNPSIDGLVRTRKPLIEIESGEKIRDYSLSPFKENVINDIKLTNQSKEKVNENYLSYKESLKKAFDNESAFLKKSIKSFLEENSSIPLEGSLLAFLEKWTDSFLKENPSTSLENSPSTSLRENLSDFLEKWMDVSLEENPSTSLEDLEEKKFNAVQVFSNSRFIEKIEKNDSDILVLEKTKLGKLLGVFAAVKLSKIMELLKKEVYNYKKIHCSFCRADLRLLSFFKKQNSKEAPKEGLFEIQDRIKNKGSVFIKEPEIKKNSSYEYKKGENIQMLFNKEYYNKYHLLNANLIFLSKKNPNIELKPQFESGLKKLVKNVTSDIYNAKNENQKYALANNYLIPNIVNLFNKILKIDSISKEDLVDILIPKITDKGLPKNFLLFLLTKPEMDIREKAAELFITIYKSFSDLSKEKQKEIENFRNYLYEKKIIEGIDVLKLSRIINQGKPLELVKNREVKSMPTYNYYEKPKIQNPKLKNHSTNAKEMLVEYKIHEKKLHHLENEAKGQIPILQEHNIHHQNNQEHLHEKHV